MSLERLEEQVRTLTYQIEEFVQKRDESMDRKESEQFTRRIEDLERKRTKVLKKIIRGE